MAACVAGGVLHGWRVIAEQGYSSLQFQYVAAWVVASRVNSAFVFSLLMSALVVANGVLFGQMRGCRRVVACGVVVAVLSRWIFPAEWGTTRVRLGLALPDLMWRRDLVPLLAGGFIGLVVVTWILQRRVAWLSSHGRRRRRGLRWATTSTIGICIVIVTAANIAAWRQVPQAAGARSDIVFVTWDSTRADHLSCYGYPRRTTPHMDELAAQGVLFERAYSQHNWTRPSYRSILTSRPNEDLAGTAWERAVTLAEVLKEHGYRTVAFTQNPNLAASLGFDQGFDEFWGLSEWASPEDVNAWVLPRAEALSRSGGPYFLFVHYQEPHWPHSRDNPFVHEFASRPDAIDRDTAWAIMKSHGKGWDADDADCGIRLQQMLDCYDASLRFADEGAGALLGALKSGPRWDETLVVFNSDHGDEFFDHGSFGHAHENLHAELTHIPLIIRFPGRMGIPPQRVAAVARNLDIYPTILDVLGIRPATALAGRSLLPLETRDTRVAISSVGRDVCLRNGRLALFYDAGERMRWYDMAADPLERSPLDTPRDDPMFEPLRREARVWSDAFARPKPVPAAAPPNRELAARLKALGYLGTE